MLFELFFGRSPNLPIDHMFQLQEERSRKNPDEWLTNYRSRLKSMYTMALNRIKVKAQQRKKRHDVKAGDFSFPLNAKVLVRNRVVGCNKIQDIWLQTVYRIIGRVKDTNAYVVQNQEDSSLPPKVLKRTDLLEYAIGSDSDCSVDKQAHDISDSSSSDSSDDVFHVSFQSTPELAQTAPRRSSRSTKGKHSNVHRLPKSVLTQSQNLLSGSKYSEFSEAI